MKDSPKNPCALKRASIEIDLATELALQSLPWDWIHRVYGSWGRSKILAHVLLEGVATLAKYHEESPEADSIPGTFRFDLVTPARGNWFEYRDRENALDAVLENLPDTEPSK